MSRTYVFSHYSSYIDICKEGYEPVLDTRWKSFLWEKGVNGVVFKQEVGSYGDINEAKTVKIRLAVIKDQDCQEFYEASSRYNQWEYCKGDVSSSIKVDQTVYQKVADLYSKALQDASKELSEKIIYQEDFDYTMPVGQSEDILTLTVPIKSNMLEANTLYRIGIYERDETPTFCHEWSRFDFFQFQKPLEEIFVPHSAYLKVRKPYRGKLYFDKSVHYRHYNDYFSDIHFDKICEEVEVNPTLVCFELEVKQNRKHLPVFNITMTSENTVLYQHFCRLLPIAGTNRIAAFCALSTDSFYVTKYSEITASLQVFDRTIACFSFFTNKTEQGEHPFDRLM